MEVMQCILEISSTRTPAKHYDRIIVSLEVARGWSAKEAMKLGFFIMGRLETILLVQITAAQTCAWALEDEKFYKDYDQKRQFWTKLSSWKWGSRIETSGPPSQCICPRHFVSSSRPLLPGLSVCQTGIELIVSRKKRYNIILLRNVREFLVWS